MPELTFQDIERIRRDVRGQDICFAHLADELLDHLCCDVEQEMTGGMNFSEAYNKVKGKLGHRRLKEIQEETLYAVDTKYRNMKNTMKISGIAGTVLLGFAALFKVMHWPWAGIMCTLGGLILAFVFMPSALTVLWKETRSGKKIFLYITAFTAGMLFIAGVVFKIQHWPFASNLLSLAVLTGVLFFIPALIADLLRNEHNISKKVVYVLFAVALACDILGILAKIQHWPYSNIMMMSGLAILFFVVLPWYVWLTWKEESSVSARFIFIIVGSLAIVIPSMLLNLSMQRNFDAGFRVMQAEQQAFFRYRSAQNLSIINGNTDMAKSALLLTIDGRTRQLISVINDVEARMISEAEGEPGKPAGLTYQVTKTDAGSEIQFDKLRQPFLPATYRDNLLPGTASRDQLDRAMLDYAAYIMELGTVTGLSRDAMLLEPSEWFPVMDNPDHEGSLMSALHLLALMKNTVLTVESRALKAAIGN